MQQFEAEHLAHAVFLLPFAGGPQRLFRAGVRGEDGNHVLALNFPEGESHRATAAGLQDGLVFRHVGHEEHQDGLAQQFEVVHGFFDSQMSVLISALQIILRVPHILFVVRLLQPRQCR